MEQVLTMRGMRHRYGTTVALDGVDLMVDAGQCIVLLGPNGAGKSTLVHLAIGLLAPQKGVVRLAGGDPVRARTRRELGVILQTAGLPRTLTVGELVRGAAARAGAHRSAVADVLEEVGIADLAGRRSHRLSGGQVRRLQLAMALVGDPALLVLDEPTEGLDPTARRAFWQALEGRRERGTGILLTTHLVEESAAVADHVVVLHAGKVIAADNPRALSAALPDRTVTVRTDLARAQLADLPGVVSLSVEAGLARLTTRAPEDLLRALLAADPQARDLLVEGAGLEDAVVALLAAQLEPVTA